MNIHTEEDCRKAWEKELRSAAADARTPEEDRDRVMRETDREFATVYDVVAAYLGSRFLRVC